MCEWKSICCAVDFSEHTWDAFQRTVELARRLEGELTLLHVCTAPSSGGDPLLHPGASVLLSHELRGSIDTWRTFAEQALGRAVRVELLAGSAAREIGRYAAEHGTDLLVVGTRGPTGLGQQLLGSVAEHVVRQARCPVMVVHCHKEAIGV